ncbi:MAG: HNH endonuclease [Sneathiella sp.]
MVKAILTTKVNPTYDDLPEDRYHFPKIYLKAMEAAVGDHIIYYEPRRTSGDSSSSGGRQSYFAVARVNRIEADPINDDHFYAYIDSYLDFDCDVSFKQGGSYLEKKLQKEDGTTNKGAFGRAVRSIPDEDFELILAVGFGNVLEDGDRLKFDKLEEEALLPSSFLYEDPEDYLPEMTDRPVVSQLINTPFRDRAFSSTIKTAYDDTCAMTGIKLADQKGYTEVQAAHIKPVKDNGPDSIRNGMALTGTMHWLFDHGLVSVEDNFKLIFSKRLSSGPVKHLFNRDGYLTIPKTEKIKPHPQFLRYHRESIFKE